MSDILPKFKLYLFVSIFSILINLGYNLMVSVYNNSLNVISLLSGFGTSFIPFVNTISMVFTSGNTPIEVLTFISIITITISIIQTFLIAMFILQTVHNIIWNPDV